MNHSNSVSNFAFLPFVQSCTSAQPCVGKRESWKTRTITDIPCMLPHTLEAYNKCKCARIFCSTNSSTGVVLKTYGRK